MQILCFIMHCKKDFTKMADYYFFVRTLHHWLTKKDYLTKIFRSLTVDYYLLLWDFWCFLTNIMKLWYLLMIVLNTQTIMLGSFPFFLLAAFNEAEKESSISYVFDCIIRSLSMSLLDDYWYLLYSLYRCYLILLSLITCLTNSR